MRSWMTLLVLFAVGCGCDDLDVDGVCDDVDLCDGDDATGDADSDGICDDGDLCIGTDAVGDLDGDGTCDDEDADDDGDTVADDVDVDPSDPNRCLDTDSDGCDDCTNGPPDAANDGADFDGDGLCDAGDDDDDDDGIDDGDDSDPRDPTVCADLDEDTCDDCLSGTWDPASDGPDFDGDGACDDGDEDDDNDTVLDGDDTDPLDPFICGDVDRDTCEDCLSGTSNPAADGPDYDSDGQCDAVDPQPAGFTTSQTVLGKTLTCSSVSETADYSQCNDAKVDDRYFPNGIECGPLWSTRNSSYTDHPSLCLQVTGASTFEVYYACEATTTRVTLYDTTWGTTEDNGYTRDIRCFFE